MANSNNPVGFVLMGGKDDLDVRSFLVLAGDGTALGIGDPVKLAGAVEALASGNILPTVIKAAAGDRLAGIVLSVDPVEELVAADLNLNKRHRLASTRRVLRVCVDKQARYMTQMDNSGSDFAFADVGSLYDTITGASPNATTGLSVSCLSNTTVSTSSGQFRVESVVADQVNAVGDYCKVIVSINELVGGLETDGV